MPDVISDFIIKKIEYWVVKSSVQETVQNQTVMIQNFFSKQAQNNPQSLYRNNPVMFLP